MATRGVMPNARALSALWMAMSASSSAFGLGLMAASPYTSTCSGISMKNTLLTSFEPGAVLMSCSAGRTVFAVVWMAPETRPSTSPSASIMVPSTTVSSSCASACGAVRPLLLRSSTIGATYSARMVSGSRTSSPSGSVRPCPSATCRTRSGLASSTGRAMPFSTQRIAAFTVRGSSPSGSTMRLAAARAFWMSSYRNALGGRRRSPFSGARRRVPSGTVSSRSAMKSSMRSIRCGSSCGTRASSRERREAVSKEFVFTRSTGRVLPSAARHSRLMLSSGPLPDVNISPASGTPLRCDSAAAMMTSSRSPGVTTSAPGTNRCAMRGTVRAVTTVLVTRRTLASPSFTTSVRRCRAISSVRGAFRPTDCDTTPSSGSSPLASTRLRDRNSAISVP